MICDIYRGVRLLEHVMKFVKKELEKILRKVVTIDDMQFDFMPGKVQLIQTLFYGRYMKNT